MFLPSLEPGLPALPFGGADARVVEHGKPFSRRLQHPVVGGLNAGPGAQATPPANRQWSMARAMYFFTMRSETPRRSPISR